MERINRLFCLGIVFCLMWALHPVPGAWAIEITDAAGRRIVLDKLPERIVVTGNAPFIPLHMLYMFDETRERLKGFEVKVRKPDEFLILLDPELGSKQTLYSNPGPESVAALKPDLVISKAMVEGNPARSLKSLGIPVLYLGAENPDMFLADIKNLGKVFGNPERADTIVQYYRDKLSLIHEIVGTAALGGKPRVLVLEYSSRGKHLSLSVPARAWIQTQQAIISGGSPVWLDSLNLQDGWQVTGFEQIAAWNPDKIFLTVWYRLQGTEVINRLYQDSKWRQLKAVQQNTLILFPSEIFGWDAATPRWILGALWMTKMTYPEAQGSHALDIKQTARQFFKILYRMDEAEVDRHILSRMD